MTYFAHGRCGFDLDYDRNEVIVWMGDVPCSNATLDVILKWIRKESQGIQVGRMNWYDIGAVSLLLTIV